MDSSLESVEDSRYQAKYVETSIDSGHDTMSSAMASSVSRDNSHNARHTSPRQYNARHTSPCQYPMQRLNEQAVNLSITSDRISSMNGDQILDFSHSSSQPKLSGRESPISRHSPSPRSDHSLADHHTYQPDAYVDACETALPQHPPQPHCAPPPAPTPTSRHPTASLSPKQYHHQHQQHIPNTASSHRQRQSSTSSSSQPQHYPQHHPQHQPQHQPQQRPRSRASSPVTVQPQPYYESASNSTSRHRRHEISPAHTPHTPHASNSSSNDVLQRSPPIDSSRLRPIRQKTRNAIVNIQEDGWVCLEFIKNRRGSEQHKIHEVFRVSQDGRRIEAYQPGGADGSAAATSASGSGDVLRARCYDYANLPRKLWKKYEYAARFVNLVRSKTPKLTLYTPRAKCMLMENSPDADFEVNFYEGSKFSESKDFTRIIDLDGTSTCLDMRRSDSLERLDGATRTLVACVKEYRSQCMELERIICQAMANQNEENLTYFPVTIGRRPSCNPLVGSTVPVATSTPELLKRRESRAPSPIISATNMQSFDGTLMSQITTPPSRLGSAILTTSAPLVSQSTPVICAAALRRSTDHNNNNKGASKPSSSSSSIANASTTAPPGIVCRVFVPRVGWASQLTNGEIAVQFSDGQELSISSDPMVVRFTCEDGKTSKFGDSEQLPSNIRKKLELLPSVMLKLESSSRLSQVHKP